MRYRRPAPEEQEMWQLPPPRKTPSPMSTKADDKQAGTPSDIAPLTKSAAATAPTQNIIMKKKKCSTKNITNKNINYRCKAKNPALPGQPRKLGIKPPSHT